MMKRKLLMLGLLWALPAVVWAQDTIIFKSGEVVTADVLAVNRDSVRYKKAGDPEALEETAGKDKIKMIMYHNGRKDVFLGPAEEEKPALWPQEVSLLGSNVMQAGQKLTDEETRSLFARVPPALSAFNTSRGLGAVGFIVGLTGSVLVGYEMGVVISGGEIDGLLTGIGIAGMVGGIVIAGSGVGFLKDSVNLYNVAINEQNSGSIELDLGLSLTGVNMTLRF
jgi:hypothetical protein